MIDREKVILGIENCLTTDSVTECRKTECPFITCRESCLEWLLRSALTLLKEQEQRVMTMQNWEANYIEKMPVWVEWSESAKGECADYEKADGWAVLNADEFVDVLCFGGRCWSSRPTNEQRKAVKWE